MGVALADCELPRRPLDGLSLEDSRLTKVRGPAVPLSNLRLSDVSIQGCDFANAVWEKVRIAAGSVSKCRLTGWNVADGVFGRSQFVDCKINLALFHSASFCDCSFQGCDLREADFQGAKLKNVVFSRCDLRNARFPGASLNGVDFRGSHLGGIQLDAAGLGGNVFDPSQLLEIARLFGLIVQAVGEERLGPRAG